MDKDLANENFEKDFEYRAILNKYLSHWKWFLLAMIISLSLAFIKLRYTKPLYNASTTILVKDDKKGGMLSELSAFSDIGAGKTIKNNLDNEVQILRSRTIVENIVRKLNLNISLIVKGKILSNELFNDAPIEVNVLNKNAEFYKTRKNYIFTEVSNDAFTLKNQLGEHVNNKSQYKFGEIITTSYGQISINKTKIHPVLLNANGPITIALSPLDDVVNSYRGRLIVEPFSKSSNIVDISIIDPVREKAEYFLNNLVQNYNADAISDKNFISENTAKFIQNRLILITDELDGVEKNAESFKKSNNLTDIESEAKLFVEGSGEYNKKIVESEVQINIVSSMLEFMKKTTNSDLLPNNIVATEGEASESINSYNQLVLNRNRILKSASVSNPSVVKIDQQITSLKSNVISSLMRLQTTLGIQKRELQNFEGVLNNKAGKIPGQERQFRGLERQQKVKEELYLYLLQKREEIALTLLATEPNARVVDVAKASQSPVSPKRNFVYLAALLLGFIIPFGAIYLLDLLDTKIKSRLDIDEKIPVPFIGDVPTSDTPTEIIITESRSSSAEALRIIRTNLEFMVTGVPDGKAKTIFLTSTFPKEGKTFVSVNLAATFALSGKKILLIGMDLRNPRLGDYLNLPDKGVTNYLSSKDINVEDLIVKQPGYEAFYILPAGVIPPNPAELLMSTKIDLLFKNLKTQYDYIIVDTAPVSVVTDTLLIAKHADSFIYVIRANFLEKRMLNIPYTLYKEKKLPNMCMLLNDTDSTKGYGYGYGYGVKEVKIPWYKKILKK